MTSSSFIDALERELRAASGRRLRLALARAPRIPAGAAALAITLAICAAVAVPLLAVHSRTSVGNKAAGGARGHRPSGANNARSVVVRCADTVSGQLAPGWRSTQSGTVTAGRIAWVYVRRNATRAAISTSHFVQGLAVVDPGRGVTVSLPARERGRLSLDYTNVSPRSRFHLSEGVSAVTFKPCRSPAAQTQFDGGFIVSGPQCVELDIHPLGTSRRIRRFIAFRHSCSPTQPGGPQTVRRILAANGIGHARFGESPATVVGQFNSLVGRPPSKPYSAEGLCNVDHAINWPGLEALFYRGRFVGYSWDRADRVLTTAKGLEVDDTVRAGERLYGSAFRVNAAQGGNWSVNTPQGRIMGYTTDVTSPKGKLMTIEAGDVGCPAMTP